MTDIQHKDITGLFLHAPSIRQATDPATDDTIAAGMFWEDTSYATGKLYKRNKASTAWDGIVSSSRGVSSLTTTIEWDDSNLLSVVVGSTGLATLTATGAGAGFYFSNNTTVAGNLYVVKTSSQFRLGYNSTHYLDVAVDSAGNVTFAAYDPNGTFGFNRSVEFASGTSMTLTGVTMVGQPTWSSAQNMSVTGNAATASGLTATEVNSFGIAGTGALLQLREYYPAGSGVSIPNGYTNIFVKSGDGFPTLTIEHRDDGGQLYQLFLGIPLPV